MTLHSISLSLAIVAALVLAIALLVPLRDDRRGRRATLMGNAPFRAVFPLSSSAPLAAAQIEVETTAAIEVETREAIAESEDAPVIVKRRPFSAFSFDALGSALGMRRRDDENETDAGEDVQTTAQPDPHAGALEFADEVEAARTTMNSTHDGSLETTDGSGTASATNGEHDLEREPEPAPERGRESEREHDVRMMERFSEPALIERSRPPLTRLPLRPVRAEITWPLALPEADGEWTPERRQNVLRGYALDPDAHIGPILCAAFREEDAAGRLLALKALARAWTDSSHVAFIEALERGSDDERAYAVDVFAERGERGPLVEALSDRLEAIAARAALALVGNGTRAEFESRLSPFVDGARLDAILGLLAAVIA